MGVHVGQKLERGSQLPSPQRPEAQLMGVAVFQAKAKPDEPTGGHKRNTSSEKRPPEPRVPIIGLDAGASPGSKPGGELGAAAYLERCGRDIVRGSLRRTRRRDHRCP